MKTIIKTKIPDITKTSNYKSLLIAAIKVADYNLPEFDLLVSMLSYCIQNNGLTKKQSKLIDPFLDDISEGIINGKK
jgi:hypothetical protein